MNGQRQVSRYRRVRCHSPRKTSMMANFPRRTSDTDWTRGCHTQRRTSYPSCFRFRTSSNALRPPSRRQMAKYRAWTGQFIDANLDSGSRRARCRTIKSSGLCSVANTARTQLGSSIRDHGAHRARADAGANTALCNSEQTQLNC